MMKKDYSIDESLEMLNDLVNSLVAFYSTKNDFLNPIYSEWTAKDVLAHIVCWHESFARNVNDIANERKPIPLKGSLSVVNKSGVLEKEIFSIIDLLDQLQLAQKLINKYIFSEKINLIPYKKGSRDYTKKEHVEIVYRHIKKHYEDLIKINNK